MCLIQHLIGLCSLNRFLESSTSRSWATPTLRILDWTFLVRFCVYFILFLGLGSARLTLTLACQCCAYGALLLCKLGEWTALLIVQDSLSAVDEGTLRLSCAIQLTIQSLNIVLVLKQWLRRWSFTQACIARQANWLRLLIRILLGKRVLIQSWDSPSLLP